jgi:hypothetical protein
VAPQQSAVLILPFLGLGKYLVKSRKDILTTWQAVAILSDGSQALAATRLGDLPTG